MSKLKVYLSSPFLELQDERKKFLDDIGPRSYLYEINAMEYYVGEDVKVLEKCKKDVRECNIYVCILGEKYGSIATEGKSFTHWEYITACEQKEKDPNYERIILLQRNGVTDNNVLNWRKEIDDAKILPAYYADKKEIPELIIKSLDNYTRKIVTAAIQKKDVMNEKIYLCDRVPQNTSFANGLDTDSMQFFLLIGHENDLPHYFIRRKELEYEEMESQWKNIDIKPLIPNDTDNFANVESCIIAEIFNKLKWKKFRSPKDITGDNLVAYMNENKLDYLSVTWFIESVYWKNNKLKEFIVRFCKEYSAKNKDLNTTKQIFFFGIITYADDPSLTKEQFENQIKDIVWENNLPPFEKIKKDNIKDWLVETDIEKLDYSCEQLINVYLKDILKGDLYFRELEGGLLDIIKLYKEEHFK